MALEHAEVRKLVLDVYAQGSTIAVGGVRVEQRVNTILGTLDTDRDGVVSMAEFVAFNQPKQNTEEDTEQNTEQAFTKHLRNSDQ